MTFAIAKAHTSRLKIKQPESQNEAGDGVLNMGPTRRLFQENVGGPLVLAPSPLIEWLVPSTNKAILRTAPFSSSLPSPTRATRTAQAKVPIFEHEAP